MGRPAKKICLARYLSFCHGLLLKKDIEKPVSTDLEYYSDWQLAQLADRDARAFEVLYLRHFKFIFQLLYRRIQDRDTAQDLCQQTFLSAWEHIGQYKPRTVFRAWLVTIGLNELKRHYRRKHYEDRYLAEMALLKVLAEAVETVVPEQLPGMLNRLSTKEQTLLALHFFDGLTYKEIGQCQGLTTDAVKMRMQRILKKLRHAV